MNATVGGIISALGQTVQGYGVDKERRIKDALASRKQTQDEERDRVLGVLSGANVRHLNAESNALEHPLPKPAEFDIVPTDKGLVRVPKVGDPGVVKVPGVEGALEKPKTDPTAHYTFPVGAVNGQATVFKGNTLTGELTPGVDAKDTSGQGPASIKTKVAANRQQLAVIDDALKELDAHPDAVGLTRGLPIVGDRLDPRADPAGVAARAQIANIGSLKMHDRSGAAVSVHEFPRLAPFIPAVNDPPDAIRIKLQKLREGILVETQALEHSSATPSGSVDHSKMSDAEFARRWKAGEFRTP